MSTSPNGSRSRNTAFVVRESASNYRRAVAAGLMQVSLQRRDGRRVVMPDGQTVVEFINCAYLGLDVQPSVIEASKSVDSSWGANLCCARSRFSIAPQTLLEEELSELWGGRAITFPSLTTTHASVMPLLASGLLLDQDAPPKVCFVFDRFAHSSMQFLKPVLAEEARVETIPHNDMEALKSQVAQAAARGEKVVYVADGIYSMGGLCPVAELMALAEEHDFFVYLDDAHGTSIFGERGEGLVSGLGRPLSDRLLLTFSLSKGFGAYGGGILMSQSWRERLIRCYGQIYAFSAALNFSAVNACRAALRLHLDGTVQRLQQQLRDRVALFDEVMGVPQPFSPIRMVHIGEEQAAIDAAERLLRMGYFVSVVFFPIVGRGRAQLRLCLAANHDPDDVRKLAEALKRVKASVGQVQSARIDTSFSRAGA